MKEERWKGVNRLMGEKSVDEPDERSGQEKNME